MALRTLTHSNRSPLNPHTQPVQAPVTTRKDTPAGGDVADASGFSPYPGNINVLAPVWQKVWEVWVSFRIGMRVVSLCMDDDNYSPINTGHACTEGPTDFCKPFESKKQEPVNLADSRSFTWVPWPSGSPRLAASCPLPNST